MKIRGQQGYVLFTVVVMLVVVAVGAFLVSYDSSLKASMPEGEAEASRADYVAEAAMQHALWRAENNACMGDVTIPTTALGQDSYAATVTGAAAGTAYSLTADQDAWIRNDDVTNNNGTTADQHIKFDSGNIEHALTRFNLSSLPADAQINSATAWFYLKATSTHPEGKITVHRVTTDWTELGATWEIMGGQFETSTLATIPAQSTGGVWVSINLTAQVQAWVNGQPNYGILMASAAEGLHTMYMSREDAGNPPRLDVVVGSGPSSPVTIRATSELESGVKRKLKDKIVAAYQPPGIVTLQLGTDPGADAMLDSFYPRNYGAQDFVQVNENTGNWIQRPVFKFGLGRIPARAAILSAQLELRLRSIKAPGTITAHRVARSWVEGTKYGTGTADGATWATHDGTNNWKTAGGDFNAAAVAETAVAATDTWVTWEIGPLVEQWLAGEPNNGLLIKSDGILEEAEFYSKEETDATLRPKLTITYACECGNACMAPQGAGNVLMVVDSTTSPWGEDIYKRDLLESWGYTVTMLADGHGQSTFDSAIAANDVILVSETIASTDLGTKLGNPAIGIVNTDGWMNDELGFESANSSNWPVGKSIAITDTSHYITAPFSAGLLAIYDADMGGLAIDNTPAPDLQPLADWPTGAGLATLDTGAMTAGGTTTAGRRVMLPFGRDPQLYWPKVNNNGHLILKRSLDWGIGNTTGSGCGSTTSLLMIVADAANPTAEESSRETLLKTWCYSVLFMTASEAQEVYDKYALNNDVVYVPASVNYADVTSKLKLQPVGVVSEVATLSAYLGFTSGTSGYTGTATELTDNTHYITSGLTLGSLPITTTSTSLRTFVNTMGPGFKTHATRPSFTYPMIMTLETGDELLWGGNAEDRRVMLPWGGNSTFDVNNLTADGQMILQRSLEWAAGADAASLGLIAHWKLDETSGTTAVDSAGGHNGTLPNGSDWMPGYLDGGLNLDGSSDHVSVPHDDTLSLSTFSITAWVQASSLSGWQIILSKGSSSGWNYYLGTTGSEISIGFQDGGTWAEFPTSGAALTTGQWYHLAGTFDYSTGDANIYLDGALIHSDTTALRPVANTDALTLGTSPDNEYWPGMLDDVRIYDRVLDAAEIATLAAAGGGGGPPGYLDEFNSRECSAADYAGTDGSLDWSSWSWTETSESNGSCSGLIQVADDPAVADPGSFRLMLDERNRRVDRLMDLSAFTTATLSFDYRLYNYPASSDSFVVIVSGDGTNWQKLAAFTGIVSHSDYQAVSYDITPFIGTNTGIGFMTEGINTIQTAYIDNVRVFEGTGGGGGGGGSCDGPFTDGFDAVNYSGGSTNWNTDWQETGETTDPSGGDIRIDNDVSNYQLQVRDDGQTVWREADLSAATSATLSFDYRRENLSGSSDYVAVEVSYDGGSNWSELDRFIGTATDSSYLPYSKALDPNSLSDSTRIRFLTPNSGMGNNNMVWFDDIEIACTP